LEVDLHFWWQSHIYNNLQLEQQKHFQTTFMQPLTQKKNNASLTNLKMMMYYLVICALLSRNCALNIPKCLELVEQVITHTFIQAIFYSPYGLSFNQVYLGGTHLDKHDRLKYVFKCIFKLDLIFTFSNLKKKLGNKYEHVHEPMIFLVVSLWYFEKFLLRKMLSVKRVLLVQLFSCTKWKKIQKEYRCKHINK